MGEEGATLQKLLAGKGRCRCRCWCRVKTVMVQLSLGACPGLALYTLTLTAVLALAMSSICRCRSSISTSIAFRAFTAAAQVNSDSSSWTQATPTQGRNVSHALGHSHALCRALAHKGGGAQTLSLPFTASPCPPLPPPPPPWSSSFFLNVSLRATAVLWCIHCSLLQ